MSSASPQSSGLGNFDAWWPLAWKLGGLLVWLPHCNNGGSPHSTWTKQKAHERDNKNILQIMLKKRVGVTETKCKKVKKEDLKRVALDTTHYNSFRLQCCHENDFCWRCCHDNDSQGYVSSYVRTGWCIINMGVMPQKLLETEPSPFFGPKLTSLPTSMKVQALS